MKTSLPTRECGLKSHLYVIIPSDRVTPYAGVWIEIFLAISQAATIPVTPYAGVWIEIFKSLIVVPPESVTPYAGVWIEINNVLKFNNGIGSLPTRECGLKYKNARFTAWCVQSLPTRECGLKSCVTNSKDKEKGHSLRGSVDWNTMRTTTTWKGPVTPYAGVWIEILKS